MWFLLGAGAPQQPRGLRALPGPRRPSLGSWLLPTLPCSLCSEEGRVTWLSLLSLPVCAGDRPSVSVSCVRGLWGRDLQRLRAGDGRFRTAPRGFVCNKRQSSCRGVPVSWVCPGSLCVCWVRVSRVCTYPGSLGVSWVTVCPRSLPVLGHCVSPRVGSVQGWGSRAIMASIAQHWDHKCHGFCPCLLCVSSDGPSASLGSQPSAAPRAGQG